MIKRTFISKFFFILALLFIATLIQPIGKNLVYSSLISLFISVIVILIEIEAKKISFSSLIGSTVGAMIGITGAVIISIVITIQDSSVTSSTTKLWLVSSLLFSMGYLGIAIGGGRGIAHKFLASKEALQSTQRLHHLILDTSAIIDGRIADIAEVGFISGKFVISQFVLKELQQVADSQDSGKRSRGRRGLDILHRLQKNKNIDIDITEVDFQDIREVDLKLIELAKQLGGKIITNDFNLNKVAQLRGVQVLNINELANALRPVVLPGETMNAFIFKEGKEYSQGVAYLDDGTMVVVDNARSKIGQTVTINVTSVLQTTAGKMIFGRVADENSLRPDLFENSREPRSEKPDRQNLPRPIAPS